MAFSGVSITRVHGIPKKVGELVFFPMFHPAAALHQPSMRQTVLADFALLPGYIEQVKGIAEPVSPPEESGDGQQLSLF